MLRSLLFFISPSDEVLRLKKKTNMQRFQVWVHRRILDKLARCYSFYAISDSVKINNLEILHECRDMEFERELQRITKKAINKSKPNAIAFPHHGSRGTHNSYISEFRFTDTLSVVYDGQKYQIRRDYKSIDMEGNAKGILKYSGIEELLRSTEFIMQVKAKNKEVVNKPIQNISATTATPTGRQEKDIQPDSRTNTGTESPKPKVKLGPEVEGKEQGTISIKRETPRSLVPKQDPPTPKTPLPTVVTKKASVEIDESFNINK